ncbi:MAG: hypothetical protein MZU95_11930 [Desulfomicrobium escambiense]|nr:hypothetical protein [Desulfomicrobium escambiense]
MISGKGFGRWPWKMLKPQVLKKQRHADGGDERCDPGRLPERLVGQLPRLSCPINAANAAWQAGIADYEGHFKVSDEVVAIVGADHEYVAVGEVDEPDDAVDHSVAQGYQGVYASQRKAIYKLLY